VYKVLRKISAAFVAIFMTTSIMSTVFANQSISKKHWAEEKMLKWSGLGIIKGSGTGDLRPDDNITRAEVATIINKTFGFVSKSDIQFIDVKSDDWYADELLKAREAGYFNGYTGNIANAGSYITREDTAVMISKAFILDVLEVNNPSVAFKDASDISGYALSSVSKLSEEGILKGYPNGTFLPKSNITRAEFISIMDNLVNVLCNSSGTYDSMDVTGNVIINQASVDLKNMTISSNLYITEGIGSGNVTLSNVSVEKNTYISARLGKINIIDSQLNAVVVNSKNDIANLVLSGTSKISTLSVKSPADITVESGVKATVDILSDNVSINGQKVSKGLALVANGTITRNISEVEPEIPASIATSTPQAVPTSTPKDSSQSNTSGSTTGRTSADNSSPTPKVTPTPTLTKTPTSTPLPTEPKLEELILESVSVLNLKEIELKFNRPLNNIDEAENTSNYSIEDNYFTGDNYFIYKNFVQYAKLSSDKTTVTLLLQDPLIQKDDIVLKVKSDVGISEDVNVEIDNIEDNEAPRIVDVTAVGNSLLKVTFSEPVQYSTVLSNYTIDDEIFDSHYPVLSYNGKTVSFYLTTPLSTGTHKLTVSNEICDYAFIAIEENEMEFTVVEDNIKPTGVLKSASQLKVVIEFSEEVEFIDMNNISTDTEAEIEGIELSDDDMALIVYFSELSPFPSSGGQITIKDLTDLSGNRDDIVIDVPPITT